MSRSGAGSEGAARLKDALADTGTELVLAACDTADRDALAALLAEHPVDAVVHTAGVLDDRLLDGMDAAALDRVLRPKLAAARNLDELTRDRDLTAFVLYSSISGTLGTIGQANYAAANACLDALAETRRAAGLPATSLAWGPWAGGGMATADAATEARMRRSGITPSTPGRPPTPSAGPPRAPTRSSPSPTSTGHASRPASPPPAPARCSPTSPRYANCPPGASRPRRAPRRPCGTGSPDSPPPNANGP